MQPPPPPETPAAPQPAFGPPRVMTGIGLAMAGYACFSVQDAIVKWLVADLPVFEILFARSIMIMIFAGLLAGPHVYGAALRSRRKGALLGRGVLILAAWLSYYSAAKWLPLAELVTLYFAAPIFVMVLSILILKEKVTLARWIAAGVGFGGVALASDPGGNVNLLPAAMVLGSAFLWAWTNVLVRIISRTEATATQMIASNFIFAVGCAAALPFLWVTPTLGQFLLLLGLGVAGGAGQYFVFEGFRHAPASAVAPFEYSALVWAFIFGFVIWGDVPRAAVVGGAVLIIASGVGLLIAERRAG
jgi:S-adenosylmethionine uptake transporter